jgi:hypothetical protein
VLQQGAKKGKAVASNNTKEHAQQELKRNWEARDTNDGVSRNDIPAHHLTKHLVTTGRDMALSMDGGGSRLLQRMGWQPSCRASTPGAKQQLLLGWSARDRRQDGGKHDEPPLPGRHREATEERDEQLDDIADLPAHEVLDEHRVSGHPADDLADAS